MLLVTLLSRPLSAAALRQTRTPYHSTASRRRSRPACAWARRLPHLAASARKNLRRSAGSFLTSWSASDGDRWTKLPFAPLSSNRSEEHTSELQSLMRISYAVFCLKKKTQQ